jgi:hypothetical protein
VKTIISHAHLVPQAVQQSDSAPATQSEVAYRNPDCSGASPTAEPLSSEPSQVEHVKSGTSAEPIG